MNHPTREEWMSFLYDETSGDQHAALSAHLAACPECTSRVGSWREVAADLDAWKLCSRPNRRFRIPTVARWAAAAAIVLSFGFAFGRASAPTAVSVEQLRAAIEPSLRQQLQQEFAQRLQAELAKSTYEKAVANLQELADLIQRSNSEALGLLNKRFAEAMDEVKGLVAKHGG